MEKINYKYISFIAIMTMTALLVNYLTYDTFHESDVGVQVIESIPMNMGKWHGKDIPMDNVVYDILETKSIIHRIYHTPNGREVFLSLVYYPETKVDFHAPESCLGGQGIRIMKSYKTIDMISEGKVITIVLNRLIMEHGTETRLVYYFYKSGEFLGRSYIKLRFRLALNRFSKKVKNGSLIRISTPIRFDNLEKANNNLIDFIQVLYPILIKYL